MSQINLILMFQLNLILMSLFNLIFMHIGLLKALAILREERGLEVPLVCSGHRNRFFRRIAHASRRLRVGDEVHFLGFVSERAISALYALARCLVFPTLFEGWGLPITEAFTAPFYPMAAFSSSEPRKLGARLECLDHRVDFNAKGIGIVGEPVPP